jgi:hypothetical protein
MGDGTRENPYTREDVLRLIEENGGKTGGLNLIGKTFKIGIKLNQTNLHGVIFNTSYLWGANASSRRFSLFMAETIYRRLKIWYKEHGIYDVAGKFFYREMEAKRKAQSWKEKPLLKFWYWIMRILCGYGEKPERVGVSASVVILGLALAYYFFGSFSPSSYLDTLYYSVVSFVALGYGSWAAQPLGWARYMGAVEAVIGVFMMALFLVTFTRKMTR